MNRFLWSAGLLLLAVGLARAEPPPGVKTIRVVLTPSLPPSPALRYPLLPELRDQKPGNAVPHYSTAVKAVKLAIAGLDDPRWGERFERWREMPLDSLPREQMRALFARLNPALLLIEEASRHEFADWDVTDKLRKSGIGAQLPDAHEMREATALLSVRARLAMAEGRLDDAVRDVQTIFAMGRHLGQSPTLIGNLIGMALSNIAAQQIDTLIQQPALPNLYWSLADLPQPLFDLRTAFQGERIGVYGTFRGLPTSPRAEVTPLTSEQAGQFARLIAGLRRESVPIPDEAFVVIIALDVQRKHEKAKQALVDVGWSRAVVDKMPHLEVAVLHGFLEYEQRMDEAVKWNSFPYWQAAPALMELEKRRARLYGLPGPEEAAYPIADLLLANSGRLMFARTRVERKLAALRCLEAMRLYAAAHGDKLPASLSDVKEAPIPVDPYTGRPFEYQGGGDKATLYAAALAPPIAGRKPSPQEALYYEIVLKK